MATKEDAQSGGVGLAGILFIVFLVLKLAGVGVVATWSWWWVTSPLWIPFVAVIAILLIVGFFGIIGLLIKTL